MKCKNRDIVLLAKKMLILSQVALFISEMTKAEVELLHGREKKLKFI
jgi:hypothetical protein